MSNNKECNGKLYCDCARTAMSGGANRYVVDGYEDCCPFRKIELPEVVHSETPKRPVSCEADCPDGICHHPDHCQQIQLDGAAMREPKEFTKSELREAVIIAFRAGERRGYESGNDYRNTDCEFPMSEDDHIKSIGL